MTLKEIQEKAFETAKAHGFWDSCMDDTGNLDSDLVAAAIPEKICLIHSELSEALEDFRAGDLLGMFIAESGKPIGFPTEMADAIIRIGDLLEAMKRAGLQSGPSLEAVVSLKMKFNESRPFKHGKKI